MRKLFFIVVMFLGYNSFAQQAWTQKKGEGYFQIGSSSLSYSALHTGDFESEDIPRSVSELILSSYSEFGISDELTISLVIPYHIVSSGNLESGWSEFAPEKGDLSGLGNLNIGMTYRIHQNNGFVVSSKFAVGLNSAKSELSTGLRTGFDATIFSPSVLAGIGKSKYFASIEIGTNILTNGYLNRFVVNAQIGKHLLESKKLLFIFGINTSTTLSSSSVEDILKLDGNAKYTGLYLNEQSYYAINLKLGYSLSDNWTIWTSMAGGAAKNVGRNAVYTLSLGFKLRK